MIKNNKTTHFDKALNDILTPEIFRWNGMATNNFLTKYFDVLETKHQQIIIKKIPLLFPEANFMERTMLFEFLSNKAECSVLKNLKQTYSRDLEKTNLPKKCK